MITIPIVINTQDISSQFDVTERDVDNIVNFAVEEITASFARRWDTEARNSLGSTRQRYRESLQVVDEGKAKGAVVLWYTDRLVEMIEEGNGAFDMKEAYAKSDKRKKKEDGGWYMHIPFRFATPSALGEDSVFSERLPQEVYDEVKSRDTNIPTSSGMRSEGLKLGDIPQQFRVPRIRGGVSSIPESKTFNEYKNKTSIFEGVQKMKDSTTGQSTYMSFRTVSDNSDPDAFIHSGINAYNLADKALSAMEANMQEELEIALDNSLSQLGFI